MIQRHAWARGVARMVQIWGYVPTLEETVQKIDAVSVEDLRRYGEHLAIVAPSALALYGPVAAAPAWTELQQRRAA